MRSGRKRTWIIAILCIVIFLIAFYIFYNYFEALDQTELEEQPPKVEVQEEPNDNSEVGTTDITDITELVEPHVVENESIPTQSSSVEKIEYYTKMVYQYIYKEDGVLREEEAQPPYYFLQLTRRELEEELPDWQIQSFSTSKVVLRKTLEGECSENYYLISEHEGFVAVYYEDGTLVEYTETPIDSLPEAEQKILRKGIKVFGLENAIKTLEDFTS